MLKLLQNTEGAAPSTIFIVCCLFSSNIAAQSPHKFLRQGDGAYLSKEYDKAEGHYRDAQSAKPTYKGSYNLGNTVYMQQNYKDAIEMYDRVAKSAPETDLRTKAYFNQGNAHMYNQEFDKAVEAYKNSVRLNPQDMDAKKNLAFAKKMLEKQQQQQQKNQQQNQNNQQKPQNQQSQGNQNQQNNSDKNQQPPQQNNPQPPQNPQNSPNNQDKQQQNQPQNNNNAQSPQPQNHQAQSNKVTNENMERQLKIMDDEDRKVQQGLKKGKGKASNTQKDW